jgi:serine/threonine-protein phosphatase 6 regulatory ankyrin repeat subunit A
VEVLLKHKADINARDRNWQTPLHIAAANNAVHCADNLIPLLPNINVTDRGGRTSLHHAAYNGHHEVGLCPAACCVFTISVWALPFILL